MASLVLVAGLTLAVLVDRALNPQPQRGVAAVDVLDVAARMIKVRDATIDELHGVEILGDVELVTRPCGENTVGLNTSFNVRLADDDSAEDAAARLERTWRSLGLTLDTTRADGSDPERAYVLAKDPAGFVISFHELSSGAVVDVGMQAGCS